MVVRKLVAFVASWVVLVYAYDIGRAGPLVNSLIIPGAVNQIEDRDFEHLVNVVGAADTIDDGDVLEAIIKFDYVNSSSDTLETIFGTSYQLTAHSRIKLLWKGDLSLGLVAGHDVSTGSAGGFALYDFVFTGGFADGTTTIKLYENPSRTAAEKFDSTTGAADGIARATSGSLVATFGFGLGAISADDFWIAHGAPDVITAFTDAAISGANFSFGQTMLTNPGGLALLPESLGGGLFTSATGATTKHDLVGTGELKKPGTGVDPDWEVQTDTLVEFVGVPEPSTLVLLGIGGLFLGTRQMLRRGRTAA